MCGLAGFCFTQDSCVNARVIARALLEGIEERGRDSSGYAYFGADGQINYNNAPVKASEFVKSRREFGLLAEARTVVLHTRLATKGTYKNPLNNHPVLAYTPQGQQVAVVHNGSVWNDDEVFDTYRLPRYGQVDTEAIPAMIAAFPTDFVGENFGVLEGGIAAGWLDERQPGRLNCVRAWDSPMVLASIDVIDRLGSKVKGIVFASTVKALTKAIESIGLSWDDEGVTQYEIGEGEYYFAESGEWDGMVYPFRLPETISRWSGSSSRYGYGYGYGTTYGWDDDDLYATATRSTGTGIGSGNVDSGKPSMQGRTFTASPDGTLTEGAPGDEGQAAVLDTSLDRRAAAQRSEDEYVAWWQEQDRIGLMIDVAERLVHEGYVPTSGEMRLIATATEIEREGLGITRSLWASWGNDYMWHMEACTGGNCEWDDVSCPTLLDPSNMDNEALSTAAKRWGFAAIS